MFQAFELLQAILKTLEGRVHLAGGASLFVTLYTARGILSTISNFQVIKYCACHFLPGLIFASPDFRFNN
jgi:hypothetical protein